MKQSWMAAAGLMGALWAVPAAAQAPATGDLVGRWGVASYSRAEDRARSLREAQGACGNPYVINRGPRGGAIMFEALVGRPVEVAASGRRISSMEDPGARTTKEVVSWDGRVLELRYSDESVANRYGIMVFSRCNR
jgi:hypothetical protein